MVDPGGGGGGGGLVGGKHLLAVNSFGRIFRLDTSEEQHSGWAQLPYLGVEFKRVSSARNSLWALGGDHQVYLYLFGSEGIPVRVRDVVYENQVWPLHTLSVVLRYLCLLHKNRHKNDQSF